MNIFNIKNNGTTKEKILYTAAMMFAKDGYENVSMRELSDAVGIRVASLYNHFKSKRDILCVLYGAYEEERDNSRPDMDALLRMAETEHPLKVLNHLNHHASIETEDLMNRIMVTAAHRVSADADSAAFVKRNLLDIWTVFMKPLLVKMMDHGKIKPFNIDTFIFLTAIYSFGGTAFHSSTLEISMEDWKRGFNLLCSLIQTIDE